MTNNKEVVGKIVDYKYYVVMEKNGKVTLELVMDLDTHTLPVLPEGLILVSFQPALVL